jgi:hypothetical protein
MSKTKALDTMTSEQGRHGPVVEHHGLRTIEDLRPAAYNPRRISDRAARALSKSLGDFGDLSGIVWNKRTGNLVCGHQRVDQLRKLGAYLDVCRDGTAAIEHGGERFVVRVVDWPEAKEKAANVVANNPAIGGEFTDELGALLDEIQADIGAQGFADLALDELVKNESEDAGALKEWDASPLEMSGMFIFTAPIEMQARVRATLEREFPGVKFAEEVVYG